MPYTVSQFLNEWLSLDIWEVDGVTYLKLTERRNPVEVGSVPHIVLNIADLSKSTEFEVEKAVKR